MPADGYRPFDLLRRAACESTCREPVPYRGDLGGVRGLRLSSRHRGVAPPRLSREQQEGATADARAWPVAEAATALQRTATTTSRSSPTSRPTWLRTDRTSSGWRTSPTSPL